MGVINLTPDSFYAGSRISQSQTLLKRVEQMLHEGAAIIDLGAASTRPGAGLLEAKEEKERLLPALKAVAGAFPQALISVDTYRPETARAAAQEGVSMINDVSAGRIDPAMFSTVAQLGLPYVLMHMQGTPDRMQKNPQYADVVGEVTAFFAERIQELQSAGVHDIIIDPGFGFGKTLQHNYHLLSQLDFFALFERPIMVGISRKSMITRLLNVTPDEALNGTTAAHMLALAKGACILRAHDVKAAAEAVKIFLAFKNHVEID